MSVRHNGNGDVDFDVEIGSDKDATLTVEWSRVKHRPGWVCLRQSGGFGGSPIWIKAGNVEEFAEAILKAGQGDPKCPHCEGSGKRPL